MPPWSGGRSNCSSTRSTSPASRSAGTAGRWDKPCRTRSVATCTPRPGPTTPAHQRRAPTGIDYLRLVEAQHTAELAERVRYSHLPDSQVPGRLHLPGIDDATNQIVEVTP